MTRALCQPAVVSSLPRKRESSVARCGFPRAETFARLPLPQGEGWGEGEISTSQPDTSPSKPKSLTPHNLAHILSFIAT